MINLESSDLHMSFVREALRSGDSKWMRRALQSGERHASFPLMFDWASMSTELRKFVTYRLIHFLGCVLVEMFNVDESKTLVQ